jgi:hypothetical protein
MTRSASKSSSVDCDAHLINAGNCVGIIGGPVERYMPGIRSLVDSETKRSSLRVVKRKAEHGLIKFFLARSIGNGERHVIDGSELESRSCDCDGAGREYVALMPEPCP